jgi:integrase
VLAKKPLTERTIAAARPAEQGKRKLIWDALVPGLALRVTDTGAKSFVLVTRFPPGAAHPTPRSLGSVGTISLAAARDKARAWLKLLGEGVDPSIRDIEKRQETFIAIASDYFQRKAKDHRSRAWTEAALARLVYPSLGTRPIGDIRRIDIVRLLDQIEDERGPVMANRTLGILNRIMNWHASRSDDFRSPLIRGMGRTEQARSRVLTDEELRAIWKAAGEYPNPYGPMLHFILLTATRRSEACHARRSEIVGSDWTIPAARYKTNHDHLIPLSKAALAVLPKGSADLIFTLNGTRPISAFTQHKAKIDAASGVTGWTIHDLRRTARSLMSRAGVPADHAERCLGHVIPGVRGIYDRHEYFEEKAHAFEALAAQMERIINPSENVVAINRSGR